MKSQTAVLSNLGAKIGTGMRQYAPLLILIGLVILFSIISPNFMTPYNILILVRQVSFVAIERGGSHVCDDRRRHRSFHRLSDHIHQYCLVHYDGRFAYSSGCCHSFDVSVGSNSGNNRWDALHQAEDPSPGRCYPWHRCDLQRCGVHHRRFKEHHGLSRSFVGLGQDISVRSRCPLS